MLEFSANVFNYYGKRYCGTFSLISINLSALLNYYAKLEVFFFLFIGGLLSKTSGDNFVMICIGIMDYSEESYRIDCMDVLFYLIRRV